MSMKKNYIIPSTEYMPILVTTLCASGDPATPTVNVLSGTFGDESIVY